MPIIGPQHDYKNPEHKDHLLDGWPDDCFVQWGGFGVVLEAGGARGTAFFEAFPKGGGFFRGEGETICDAEASAYDQFSRARICDHGWSRKAYRNGGCICRKCGAFETRMNPVTVLGGWREPIDHTDLGYAISPNFLVTSRPKDKKVVRRLWLRLRLAGFDLPPPPTSREATVDGTLLGDTPYARTAKDIIFSKLRDAGGLPPRQASEEGQQSCLSSLFQRMASSSLQYEYDDWLEAQEAEDISNGPI